MNPLFPVRRNRGVLKFGYQVDPNNPFMMVPDPDALAALSEAFDLLSKGCSYRDVAHWLSATTERPFHWTNLRRAYLAHRRKKHSRKLSVQEVAQD